MSDDEQADPLHVPSAAELAPGVIEEMVARQANADEVWVGTEDDKRGGLEAVLADTLEHYGLPWHGGLSGLLRHLEGNRAMTEGIQRQHIQLLNEKNDALQARVEELEAKVQAKEQT